MCVWCSSPEVRLHGLYSTQCDTNSLTDSSCIVLHLAFVMGTPLHETKTQSKHGGGGLRAIFQ